jgi:tetratricopeptide (TPR) repeat protein
MRRDFLRDHVEGPDAQRLRHVAEVELAAARTGTNTTKLVRALLRAGEACRFVGDYDASTFHHEEAIGLTPNLEHTRMSRLALATTLQYRGEHERAAAMFRGLLDEIRETPDRTGEDYVLQHFGKCLAEMGRLTEATEMFLAALRLREAAGPGAAALADSSRRALAVAREWMSTNR